MRLGVVLPTFARTAELAIDAAHACEREGIDGVFVYDHLWPMGHPGQPAISAFPMLGALAATTERVLLGTLVARVGLVTAENLVSELATVAALSSGRFIAGIGTGDKKGADELAAFGLEFARASDRRAELIAVAMALGEEGVPVWIGGGSGPTNEIAYRLGLPLNLWAVAPEVVAHRARSGPVTWGGNLPGDPRAAVDLLSGLDRAGAGWAVLSWPGSTAPILAAATAAGIR